MINARVMERSASSDVYYTIHDVVRVQKLSNEELKIHYMDDEYMHATVIDLTANIVIVYTE